MIKNHERDSYKWIVLGISFSLMLVFAISLQSLPPIFGNIMKDIPFSNKQAGLLMSVYSIIGIFFPFFVAFSAEKLDITPMLHNAAFVLPAYVQKIINS